MNKPHIEITTRIGCKINCAFCPQEKLIKNYKDDKKILSFDDFKKYLDKIPKTVNVHFSGMAEPFLNENCLDMIKFAYVKGYNISVFTTLTGIDLNIYEELLKIKFDMFCVHIADDNNLTKIKVDDDYIKLLDFVDKNRVNCNRFWYQCHGYTHRDIEHIVGKNIDRYIINRAGNVESDMFKKINIKGKFVCSAGDLNQNILLPNGDIVLCCMDYKLEHILGNLNYCGYEELDKSYIYKSMDGECESLCNKCNRAVVK